MDRFARPALALLALGAAAVGGCGSSASGSATGSGSGTRPTPTATATQAASPTPTATATAPGGAGAAPARCHTSQLAARVVFGPGSGTAGHLEGALVLTNRSQATCTVHGFPGVSFVGAGGRQLGAPAARTSGSAPRTVTLSAGAKAGARLRVTDVGVFDPAECRPVTARGFRVYPPDERDALYAPHRIRTCRSSRRVATIGPMQKLSALPAGTG